MAVAVGTSANPTFSARIAPTARATLDTDGFLRNNREQGGTDGFIAMNADEMTT